MRRLIGNCINITLFRKVRDTDNSQPKFISLKEQVWNQVAVIGTCVGTVSCWTIGW